MPIRHLLPIMLLPALLAVPRVAQAQPAAQVFANPPVLAERPAASAARETLRGARIAEAFALLPSERRTFDLTVAYRDGRIWNPSTSSFDRVHLRSYQGEGTDAQAPYVAPMIEVSPGQTVSITLHNKLPADPTCTAHDHTPDAPHCFNGTNLHSHGLWVSPTGNSDNVLLSINPGVDFQYIYNLPPDHPSGTFWYHTHRHGSTALQVSSGMAGALIVRGDRKPTAGTNGDIDVILKNRDLTDMDERVLVLQQIQYACLDKDGAVKVKKDAKGDVVAWVCDPGDVGVIESYKYPGGQGFGPGSWPTSGRFTTINGLVRPVFEARAGRPERWRLIHGGVRDTITLGFRRRKANAAAYASLDAKAGARYVEENCTGDLVPYERIAADGLTMARAQHATTSTLQPGYRWDALVVFPRAGDYCVVDESAPGSGSVSREATSRQLLGIVEVGAGTDVADIDAYLRDHLVAVAKRVLDGDVRDKVVAALNDGFQLTSFTPHPDVTDAELTGKQELVFFIKVGSTGATFEVGNKSIDPAHFDPATFDPQPYKPERIDRKLRLGGADEWTLQSAFVSHPFHIHVNPFQIMSIIDPKGRDVSAPGVVDDADPAGVDPQYAGLKGVWKDTLWVKDLIEDPADFPSKLASSMYTIKVRTRYERYIGEYVLHCHILDHEDQGMMQNVEVEIPDGNGGLAGSMH